MIALALVVLAAGCETCHAQQHEQWQQSRHASSHLNPLFLASFEKHRQRRWCLGCHEPQPQQSVGCTSCHLPGTEHTAKVEGRVCAKCHDFDVPKAFGIATGPMQNTWDEWAASGSAKTCAGCHDHAARSGHDPKVISEALKVEVRRKNGIVTATVSAPGAGHAIPTGDPFRRLMFTAGERRKRVVVPPGKTVTLELGATGAKTWQLTYLHAEVEVQEHDHPLFVMEGVIE